MATVADVRLSGTTLDVLKRPIYEPINAPVPLEGVLGRFSSGDYNLTFNSVLFKFLLGLAGENGAGSNNKLLLLTKLQSLLQSTHFNDLDKFYGNVIGLSRLPSETYTQNPYTEALTAEEWDIVISADASYRHRCLMWVRAIMKGGSPEGMALAGLAASGVECDIVEQYRYLDDNTNPNLGKTSSRNEFIIVPRTPSLDLATERSIMRQVDKLRPTNTLPTIYSQPTTKVAVTPRAVSATSTGYQVQRFVTGRSDIQWPSLDPSKGYWITTTEQEAPSFAFMEAQETTIFITINTATSSSSHIGVFNSTQQSLFPVLAENTDPLFTFSASRSYAPSYAPIQVSSPWANR